MFQTKILAFFLSLGFFAKLNDGSQAQQQSSFITLQQSSTKFFSLITNSTTSDLKEQDGTTSLIIVTNVSYVFDNFTYTVSTTSKYNTAQLISVKTEAFTGTNVIGGKVQNITKYTQMGCSNGTNIGTTTKATSSTSKISTASSSSTTKRLSSSTAKASSLASTISSAKSSAPTTTRTTTKTSTSTTTLTTKSRLNASNILVLAGLNSIRGIDLDSGLFIKSIELENWIQSILLINKNYVITSDYFGKIDVWDLSTSMNTCTFNNTDRLLGLVLIDNQYFASSHYFSIKIWNYLTFKMVFQHIPESTIVSVVYIGNGYLAYSDENFQIRILDVYSLKIKANITLADNYEEIFFNEKFLLFAAAKNVYLWNKNNFLFNKSIPVSGYSHLKLFNDYVVVSKDFDVLIYSISNSSLVKRLDAISGGHRNYITDAVLFENSGLYVTIGLDKFIKIWDLKKLTLKKTIDQGYELPNDLLTRLFSIGKSYIITYGESEKNYLWDLDNGALVYIMTDASKYFMYSCNVNSNFTINYPTTTTNKVQTTTSKQTTTTKSVPQNLTFTLITASENSPIKFWSSNTGRLNATLNNSFSQDAPVDKLLVIEGDFLCSAHRNGMIQFWNLKNKSLIAVIDNGTKGYSSGIASIEYLGNGLLASSRFKYENAYSIAIWDLNKNYQLKYEIIDTLYNNFFSYPSFTFIADGFLWIAESSMVWDIEEKLLIDISDHSVHFFYNFISINQTFFAGLIRLIKGSELTVRIYTTDDLTSYVSEYFIGISGKIEGSIYSIDNNYLAVSISEDYDFRIMILSIKKGDYFYLPNGHRNVITSVVYIGNSLLAISSKDAKLYIWDINTLKLICTFDNIESSLYNDYITKLLPIDGLYLASMSKYTIKLWDLNRFTLKYRFNNSEAGSDLINNDIAFILTSTPWTTKSSTPPRTTKTKTKTSTSTPKILFNSSNILVIADFISIKVIDLNNGLIVSYIVLRIEIYKIILIDNKHVITSTDYGEMNVWDLSTSMNTCTFDNTDYIKELVLIDDQYFVSVHYFVQSIKIWNFLTCKMVFQDIPETSIGSVVYIGNGNLAYSDENFQIRILDVYSLKIKANITLAANSGEIFFNEKFLFFAAAQNVYLWNKNNFLFNKSISISGYTKFNSLNDYLVISLNNDVLIYSISNSSLVKRLDAISGGHRNYITDAVLFENIGLYVTIGADKFIKIWDLNKLTLKNTIDLGYVTPTDFVSRLFSIGKNYLLSHANDQQKGLWDVNNGVLIYSLEISLSDRVLSNVNSNFTFVYPTTTSKVQTTTTIKPTTTTKKVPNNATYNLITASENSTIKFWSSSTGRLNATFSQDAQVDKLVVIEGKFLCSAHKNGMIKLWNLKNKTLIAVIDNGVKGYTSGIDSIEYLGNGLLASSRFKSEKQYSIAIWDLNKNNQLKYEIKDSNNNYFSYSSFNFIADGYLYISDVGLIWDVERKAYKDIMAWQDQAFINFIRINQTHFAGMVEEIFDYGLDFWKTIRIYNSLDLTSIVNLFPLDDNTNTNFYSIDNNYLVFFYGDNDFRIRIVDINDGEAKCEFDKQSHRNAITYLTNIGKGFFATGSKDALIKIWDINTCSLVNTFDNYESDLDADQIIKLVSIEGSYLASISQYSIKLWDLNTMTLKYRFNNSEANIDLAYYNNNNNNILQLINYQ